MQAEQIAKSLGNAKRANGQWVASCPVPSHGKGNGDKNPSLSVHIDDEGKPLFHCHGGCTQESVFQTIRDMQLLPELEERPDPLANSNKTRLQTNTTDMAQRKRARLITARSPDQNGVSVV